MPKLTVLEVKSMKEPGRLADGNGLFFEYTSSGVKRWLYRFKIDGKGGMYIVGRYPKLSLTEAREKHREAKELVRQGLNPSLARRSIKKANIERQRSEIENSFEKVALEWIEKRRDGWSESHVKSIEVSLKKNVFPFLGSKSVDLITPPEVFKVLNRIEARGSMEIARKVLQRLNGVFRYSIQTGRATYNPAADMKDALKAQPVEHMPSLIDKGLSQLLKDISASKKMNVTTKLALQFTALTACRPGEVRGAQWTEIDLDLKEWHIPAERMKKRRPHIVPLSKQALKVIEKAGNIFGKEGLVFPSVQDRRKAMSDNAMSKALRDMGYGGKATPHGFRASFSTMANEKSGFPSEVIEKALAHEERNKIRGAYNRAEYLEQRRRLMQWWGDRLQALEYGAPIIPISESLIVSRG